MKNIIFAILFFIFSGNRIYAHGEGVHQHMVREAYKLLKHFIGQDIREMKDHVGYNEQGNGQFNPGNLIVIGAYQEDHSDATNEGSGIGGFMASNTHFWDPDQGDNSKFNILGISYSNAYQKARKYINGGYELRVPYENGIIEAYSAPSNLFQFYKDGQIYYKGYYDILGQFISRNRWNTASLEFRNKVVWELLGRVCHLLGDMSVPAHTHNDPHYPDLDSYEEWMNQPSIYNQWTYQNAINQGGLINPTTNSEPLKYLFYSTSQITSFFPSDDVDGNNGSGINDPFTYYSGLNEFINNLNSQYNNPPAHGDPITNNLMNAISNNSFVYGIRSISGLLYLFAKEADLLPQPLVSVSLFGDNTLYAGGIGHWSVSLQNGIEPFTYNWQIMYLNGIEYLQRDENLA
ncbi:MAG: hypothetical protein RBS48_08975, partial [Ignavibacteriaceae bacterium]|nr:hypothetical protein [Ignavibacteriaceae bacterium]